jgi:RNA polymerase sigma factor (sigma-70 family)
LDDLNQPAFVDKVRQGDVLAFKTLFDHLVAKLRDFIVASFGVSWHDAEEIVSDAMLKVHKSVARFDPGGGAKLTTWIFEITRNTTIDHLRRQVAQRKKAEAVTPNELGQDTRRNPESKGQTEDPYEIVSMEQRTEGSVQSSAKLRQMRRAFDSLSDQDRDILRMRRVMEYDEIAKVETISVNAARVRHARAEERLRLAFEKGKADG